MLASVLKPASKVVEGLAPANRVETFHPRSGVLRWLIGWPGHTQRSELYVAAVRACLAPARQAMRGQGTHRVMS